MHYHIRLIVKFITFLICKLKIAAVSRSYPVLTAFDDCYRTFHYIYFAKNVTKIIILVIFMYI
jgi:hypothetical protein